MLNWSVWKKTDYLYENGFGVNKGWYAIKPKQPTNQPSLYFQRFIKMLFFLNQISYLTIIIIRELTQLAGAIEYTDYFSAVG